MTARFRYFIGDSTILSDLLLELPISSDEKQASEIVIEESKSLALPENAVGTFESLSWTEDRAWISVNSVSALAERGQRIHWCCSQAHERRSLIAHISHYLLPMLFAQRGWVFLHASAFIEEDGITVFLGNSGAGKSTTAAVFAVCRGVMLADDALGFTVEGDVVKIQSFENGMALNDKSLEIVNRYGRGTLNPKFRRSDGKWWLPIEKVNFNPSICIKRVVVLDSNDGEPIPATVSARMIFLSRYVLRSTLGQQASQKAHLKVLSHLASKTEIVSGCPQKILEELAECRNAVGINR